MNSKRKEDEMPKLKEVKVSYEQIFDLARQLRPDQKTALMISLIGEKTYREGLYRYAEKLAEERGFSHLGEEDVERWLHEGKG